MPTGHSASGPGGAQASITVQTHDDRTTAMTHAGPKQFLAKVADEVKKETKRDSKEDAERKLARMISPDQYIGDLITLDYGHADILVHDTQRNRANGIPHGCLLLATRITPVDLYNNAFPSDPSLLLIRVSESARLRSDADLETARLDAVKRANDTDRTYDESGQTDQFTLNMLRYSGIRCRILGTFRACPPGRDGWTVHFGSDISNFNAGQGMKIYKPTGDSLEEIVNRRRVEEGSSSARRVGRLRYSAAVIEADVPEAVPVSIQASDFIAQRTALFGMTRTGKSNTTKTIAKALFELRSEDAGVKVGQLIFDPNGEYANDNPQDQGCLRNLQYERLEYEGQVQTYGSHPHPHDPERNITKFNFYGAQEPQSPPMNKRDLEQVLHGLYRGKQIIDDALAEETAGYVTDFVNARLDDIRGAVGERARGEYTRFRRRLFVYRCTLANAGFTPPEQLPVTNGLFSKEIRDLMRESPETAQYVSWLDGNGDPIPWDVAGNFVQAFAQWTKTDAFKRFDRDYAETPKNRGRNWADSHLKGLLRIYDNTRGLAMARNARVWHDLTSDEDYAEAIVRQVRDGNLVIVDQLLGDPDLNRQAAKRIVLRLFNAQQQNFVNARLDPETGEFVRPPHVIIYAEEAHTLLPRSSEDDNTNIWARIAKEGAKFNIGMVYSTQEPSSIQANILKNTENWFIAHLNNTDETNQISKFNDFKDFAGGIINVSEKGLVKMRTQSSYFTIPVQIDEFKAPPPPATGHRPAPSPGTQA